MIQPAHHAPREPLPGTRNPRDRDISLNPPGDHDQSGQDTSQTSRDLPAGSAPREHCQMSRPERRRRPDTPTEEKQQATNAYQASGTVSPRGRNLPSSDFMRVPGPAFQTRLSGLLQDNSDGREASAQSEQARAWDKLVSGEDRLRGLRMRADKHRQKARLKRREMRSQLNSFAKLLGRKREPMQNSSASQLSQQSKELEKTLLELDAIEEELDGPEVEIVKAEWDLSHLLPRPLGSQNADETFRLLVENGYHFPADEGGTGSYCSSLGFTEEPSHDADVINSKLATVTAIEERILQLQNQPADVAFVPGDVEVSSIPLPAEQRSELQRLKDALQHATSDLEQSRDLLRSTPEDDEAVQSDSLDTVLQQEQSSFSARPPDKRAKNYTTTGSLRVEVSPTLSPARFRRGDDIASGRNE